MLPLEGRRLDDVDLDDLAAEGVSMNVSLHGFPHLAQIAYIKSP
jgi:hypothetical protein